MKIIIKFSKKDNIIIDFNKGYKYLYEQLLKYDINKKLDTQVLLKKESLDSLLHNAKNDVTSKIVTLANMTNKQDYNYLYTYEIKLKNVNISLELSRLDSWQDRSLYITFLKSDKHYYDDKVFIEGNNTLSFSDFIAMVKMTEKGIKTKHIDGTETTYIIGDNIALTYAVSNKDNTERYSIDTFSFID